ncbi:MAG: fructosamine kinase family protein [Methylococcales symbiont of Hymedesmia sp. n. MRB-2018]|nr:MAG: fructosamine kinase family protein [Methylococcales symbiont of Hymedesmia sp. n. MRB-2018]KAF3983931.1 MAG: fructosamine kinase family protein [Methylococcales symbiont of Hymedesmia sp. n. MRB-2018]
MTNNKNWQKISAQIEQVTHQAFSIRSTQAVSGGCINAAYSIQSDNKSYFVKLNQLQLLPMFEAEFLGLKELAQTKTIKVPEPIVYGVTDSHAFIVLEKLSLVSETNKAQQIMGQQLAQLHKIKQAFFGWSMDNTIGSTRQMNNASNDWPSFWAKNRLGFQLSLAANNGYDEKLIQSGYNLAESLTDFFTAYSPQPSLLHGDLWSGNVATTDQGEAVIYDPACYYGDRETDIAMTELFGSFNASFYAAYNEVYPLHVDYSLRRPLYNLYHILNHLNLFGESYLYQAQNMIDSLLSEIS